MSKHSKTKKLRKYEPIWEQIKSKGKCTVTVPIELHRRVIKAVIKEKDKDTAFKLLAAEDWRWNRLQITKNGSIITFILLHEIGHLEL